jgi:CubicO group peptidase (beta-lactamase class C family)
MKRITLSLVGAIVLAGALGACDVRAQIGGASARATTRDARDTARIARIERGLLPSIAVRGQRDTTYLLADRMRRYNVPGVSVAVIDVGRVAWARAWGVRVANGTQPVDTATLFQAGSISKAITAVAALRHVERGRLRLDEDVNRRLVSWKVPPGPWSEAKPVTLRGLLSHGAGFNLPSFRGYPTGSTLPTMLQILDGLPPANTPPIRVEVAPGTEWRYSGGGITVVQQLLSDVSGQPFERVLREAVFQPAGMTSTLAGQRLPADRAAAAATAHAAGAPVEGGWRMHPEIAAAGLWSTAPDLARFGVAVLRAIRGDRGALLGSAIARDLATRQIGDWGLGFALGRDGDSLTVGHDGSTAGFTARLLVLPGTGQGIAVMTNGESEALIDEIMRAVASEYAWPTRPRIEKTVAVVDPDGLAALAGNYRVTYGDRNFDFVVSIGGEGSGRRLLITGASGKPGELLPLSETRFFSRDTGNEFTFAREGSVFTTMRIDQQGQQFTAKRMP